MHDKDSHFTFTCLRLAVAGTATAETFKWADKDGNVYFDDKPPPRRNTETVTVRANTYHSVTIGSFGSFERGPWNLDSAVMYSTAWCGVCKKAKQYFTASGIA